jgi:type VI secretion system protein ImpK
MAPWPGDLEVIGHTDRQPIRASRFASNQALSEARANTVAEELRKTSLPNGVSAPPKVMNRVITSVGMGESEPLDPADNPAAYSKNRRVDVLWKVVPEGRKDRWNARGSIADAAPEDQVNEPQVPSPQRSVNQEVNRDNP